jgi:hypothetical protein
MKDSLASRNKIRYDNRRKKRKEEKGEEEKNL